MDTFMGLSDGPYGQKRTVLNIVETYTLALNKWRKVVEPEPHDPYRSTPELAKTLKKKRTRL